MPARKKANVEPREVASDYFDDDWVEIFPAGNLVSETARALLDTAEQIGYDPARAVVAISGGFRVPQAVLTAVELPDTPTDRAPVAQVPLPAIAAGAAPNPTDGPA